MITVCIRCPDDGETPLSHDERLVAIREGFHPCDTPRWHPAIILGNAMRQPVSVFDLGRCE